MGMNASPAMEREVVARLYANPMLRELYPKLPDFITDKTLKAIVSAIYKFGKAPKPEIIAETSGIPVEKIREALSAPVDEDLSIGPLVEALGKLYLIRSTAGMFESAWKRVSAGVEDPMEAAIRIANHAASLGVNGGALWSSERWLMEKGQALAAERAKRVPVPFPPEWYALSKAIPDMEYGLYFVLAMSSVGKTGFSLMLAQYLASKGMRVLFRGNEETEDTMQWRWIAANHSKFRFNDLRRGAWDKECEEIVSRARRSGGDVIYLDRDLPPLELMATAKSIGAKAIFVDVFQNMSMSSYRRYGSKDVNAIDDMLRDFAKWCRQEQAIVFGTLQLDKLNALTGEVNALAAKGSGDYFTQASLFLTVDFPQVATSQVYNVADPFEKGRTHKVGRGQVFPVGLIKAEKNRYGPRGALQYVWFDKERMWYRPFPEHLAEVARSHYETVKMDNKKGTASQKGEK